MKASEARIEYFEHYVEYEHNIRKLIRIYKPDFSTAGLSLDKILDNLSTEISSDPRIRIGTLRRHKNVRNWLAHQPRSAQVPEKYLVAMEEIREINLFIIYLCKSESEQK